MTLFVTHKTSLQVLRPLSSNTTIDFSGTFAQGERGFLKAALTHAPPMLWHQACWKAAAWALPVLCGPALSLEETCPP